MEKGDAEWMQVMAESEEAHVAFRKLIEDAHRPQLERIALCLAQNL